MTNKKLKMAAMSVALTACVAASPLAANADAPEAAPEELKKEPVAEETKKEENTAEPQDNKQSEKAQETLKDAEVKYDKENPTTNPDGSQKLDGVIVTKLDGTAKGGIALAVSHELGLPIYKIGVGEGLGDLKDFDAHDFARALVGEFDEREAR